MRDLETKRRKKDRKKRRNNFVDINDVSVAADARATEPGSVAGPVAGHATVPTAPSKACQQVTDPGTDERSYEAAGGGNGDGDGGDDGDDDGKVGGSVRATHHQDRVLPPPLAADSAAVRRRDGEHLGTGAEAGSKMLLMELFRRSGIAKLPV